MSVDLDDCSDKCKADEVESPVFLINGVRVEDDALVGVNHDDMVGTTSENEDSIAGSIQDGVMESPNTCLDNCIVVSTTRGEVNNNGSFTDGGL